MANEKVLNSSAANRDVPRDPPSPFQDCRDVVHILLFFDGTGNNKDVDEATQKWSNVARIYHAAQAKAFLNCYPIYISGVGTPYNGKPVKWLSAPSVWLEDGALGSGAGAGGERRLDQGSDTVNDRLKDVLIANAKAYGGTVAAYAEASCDESFEALNGALGKHRLIKMINISIFGFSRGAALARAFSNQLIESCKINGIELMYQGYPIRINFMGLFDTVASFGLPANNLRTPFTQRDLIVSSRIERCVHYVAAHEIRREFPVDLIRKDGKLAGDWVEVVYPGVHSDVGGGYEPMEQEIDNDYARIPMREMLREATASGVRILSYQDLKRTKAQLFHQELECQATTEAAFAKYMAAYGPRSASIEEHIVAHQKLFYSICGTMYRKGMKTPGDRRRDENKLKYLGAKGMAYEIAAYRLAVKAGKWIRFGDKVIDGYAKYVKAEQWQIDAWDSPADSDAVHFVSRYVHDSMVDFLGNVVDSSYFRVRGIEESGESIWQKGARWFHSQARGIHRATDAAARAAKETAEAAQRRATQALEFADKKAEEAAHAANRAYDATAKAAREAAEAAQERAVAAAAYAKRKADEATAAANEAIDSGKRSVEGGQHEVERIYEKGTSWVRRKIEEVGGGS